MNQFKIEYIKSLADYPRHELDELIDTKPKNNVKRHMVDIVTFIHHKNNTSACLVRDENNKIVGGSAFYCKNINTPEATSSLYNLFSLKSGAGSVAFKFYWNWSVEKNARWYKFYADLGAYEFYKKYGVKYFGVSKTGQTLSSMGLIYSEDILISMKLWEVSYNELHLRDRYYFEKNYKIFLEKHLQGVKKLKKAHQYVLDESILPYKIRQAELPIE